MGFIMPWDDEWYAEERSESFILGYGPKEWAKSPVVWDSVKDGEGAWLVRDQLVAGLQRVEVELKDLDSVIDLLNAIKARRDSENPVRGLARFAANEEALRCARNEEDGEFEGYERLPLEWPQGWPEEIIYGDRVYVLAEGEAAEKAAYPVRDYVRKLRSGLTSPTPRTAFVR